MKLASVKIENHKRLADLEIEVRDHLVLVGANDVGKSSVLRCLDLLLGASTAQLYSQISIGDFRSTDQPLIIEATLTGFSVRDKEYFPDEIHVDPATNTSHLLIRLVATVDQNETILIERTAPGSGTARQLSREQLIGIGWKFLSATAQTRDLRDGRRSALDDILQAVDLGAEKSVFETITDSLTDALSKSKVLEGVRGALSEQLSKALPEKVARDDLAFTPGAAADSDPLSDVRLQISKQGVPHDLSEQSDGTRALFAIALYDLMSVGANMVGIDEPEVHLHPSSQRSLARLLRANPNQKIIATHSADIVGAFDPDSIVVVRRDAMVQPKAGFLGADQRMFVRWWVRDKLEPLTARRVVGVEGISDRIVLERAAEVTGRDLDRLGVSVVETGGSGDMGAIRQLFGPDGFSVPVSLLIDRDAVEDTADKFGVAESELNGRSIWISERDLEEEYTAAIGHEVLWDAIERSGHFGAGELDSCARTGPGNTLTADDVAAFCRRRKHGYKARAAMVVAGLLTDALARKIKSIEDLLGEIAS